jgi:uncharacterized protein (TIGR00299 family) protein
MKRNKTALYFDCQNGISGDMVLGALLDLGVEEEFLIQELSRLGMDNSFELDVKKTRVSGIVGTSVDVIINAKNTNKGLEGRPAHVHRAYKDIRDLVSGSSLCVNIKEKAGNIFHLLAVAEAGVHGMDVDDVSFHEVGAIDSIIDIVGVAIAIDSLRELEIYTSIINDGNGSIECQHGVLPVPVPAVLKMSEAARLPIRILEEVKTEMVTPTGYAILGGLKARYIANTGFIVGKCGYGFGKRDTGRVPVLRAMFVEILERENENAIE